jgi:hypothetical protein
MIDFFRYTSNFDCCTVEYEEWFNNPSTNIEKLQKFLDLSWQQSEADFGLMLSGIIDPAARHDYSDHREAGQPLVRTLYKLAARPGQDGSGDQIAYIVSQFVGFQQLQSVSAGLRGRRQGRCEISRDRARGNNLPSSGQRTRCGRRGGRTQSRRRRRASGRRSC